MRYFASISVAIEKERKREERKEEREETSSKERKKKRGDSSYHSVMITFTKGLRTEKEGSITTTTTGTTIINFTRWGKMAKKEKKRKRKRKEKGRQVRGRKRAKSISKDTTLIDDDGVQSKKNCNPQSKYSSEKKNASFWFSRKI